MLQNVSYLNLVPKSGYKVTDSKLLFSDELLTVGDVRTSGIPVKNGRRGEYYKFQENAEEEWLYAPEPDKTFYPPLVTESNFLFANES